VAEFRLVLASGSARRRELLARAGIPFVAVTPSVDELAPERGDPHAVARANARRKAQAVPGDAVLAADTVVALGDRLIGKPRDDRDARAILRGLSGTTHRVVTAVALRTPRGLLEGSVETRVTMRPLSDAEIDEYVATGEAAGKAGAYAVQESGDRFVLAMDGPYDNVVGLPVECVRALFRQAGLTIGA